MDIKRFSINVVCTVILLCIMFFFTASLFYTYGSEATKKSLELTVNFFTGISTFSSVLMVVFTLYLTKREREELEEVKNRLAQPKFDFKMEVDIEETKYNDSKLNYVFKFKMFNRNNKCQDFKIEIRQINLLTNSVIEFKSKNPNFTNEDLVNHIVGFPSLTVAPYRIDFVKGNNEFYDIKFNLNSFKNSLLDFCPIEFYFDIFYVDIFLRKQKIEYKFVIQKGDFSNNIILLFPSVSNISELNNN